MNNQDIEDVLTVSAILGTSHPDAGQDPNLIAALIEWRDSTVHVHTPVLETVKLPSKAKPVKATESDDSVATPDPSDPSTEF